MNRESIIANGRALYVDKNGIWCACGMKIAKFDFSGHRRSPWLKIGTYWERLLAEFRPVRQLLRIGIHHLLPLYDGNLFVLLRKRALVIDRMTGRVLSEFRGFQGNKPAHRGVCLMPNGTILLGEYTLNPTRTNVSRLFRSRDNGQTFQCIKSFGGNEVRHIHFVEYDACDNVLWLGTGDTDEECGLWRSTDSGDTWEKIGGGSQKWRAVGVSPTPDALYWGTDAGTVPDRNFLMKLDKHSLKLTEIAELEGPCHGNAANENGTVFVSTGVEGGINEQDRFAHLKYLDRNGNLKELFKQKKDILPLPVQFGVIRFPMGNLPGDNIVYTKYALRKAGEQICQWSAIPDSVHMPSSIKAPNSPKEAGNNLHI